MALASAAWIALGGVAAAAVTALPTANRFEWNFELISGSMPFGGGANYQLLTVDWGLDQLQEGERAMLEVWADGVALPYISRILNGVGTIGQSAFSSLDTADNPFPERSGRVVVTMLAGTADLHRLVLSERSPAGRSVALIQPDLKLVPETGALALATAGFLIVFGRRVRRRGAS